MAFFNKVKQFLGVGGVKLKIEIPSAEISKDTNEVSGQLIVTAKSPQHVEKIDFELEETYSKGKEREHVSLHTLGTARHTQAFDITPGETKTISFKLPFTWMRSMNQAMAEKGGLVGGFAKLGGMLDNERSTFKLKAAADVKGTALPPTDSVEVFLK